MMKILLAIDDSVASQQAIRAVQTRPWPSGSTIRVLSAIPRVLPPPPPAPWLGITTGYRDMEARRRANAEAFVTRIAESIRRGELDAEGAVRTGSPRTVILDEARRWSADLVILASRGFTGLKAWMHGSVSRYIAGHAPCSVEVVGGKSA